MGDKLKAILIGVAVLLMSALIYLVFSGDEQKKALETLLKWSLKKKSATFDYVTNAEKSNIAQKTSESEKIQEKLDKINDAKHDLTIESSSLEESLHVFNEELAN